jgi:hypothetical protein
MDKKNKPCDSCGHDRVAWMPFVKIDDKVYCGTCIKLGIGSLKDHENDKKRRIAIIKSDIATIDGEEVRCQQCKKTPTEENPVLVLKDIMTCTRCGHSALTVAFEIKKRLKITRELKNKRNN